MSPALIGDNPDSWRRSGQSNEALDAVLELVKGPEDLVHRKNDSWCAARSGADKEIEGLAELRVAAAIFLGHKDLLLGEYTETKENGKEVTSSILDLAVRFGMRGFATELARLGVPLHTGLHESIKTGSSPAVEALKAACEASPSITRGISSMSIKQWSSMAPEELPEGSQHLALQVKNPATFHSYPHLQSPKAFKKHMWFSANKFGQLLKSHEVDVSACSCCKTQVTGSFEQHLSSKAHFDKLCGSLHEDYEVAHRTLWQTFDAGEAGLLRFNHADGKIQTDL